MLSYLYSISFGIVILAQGGAPSDVPANHWAYKAVDELYRAGILQGYPGGAFRGDRTVSRDEMAAALGMLKKGLTDK